MILTAYPDVESAITGIREQVDEYIVKPSDPDTLVAILAFGGLIQLASSIPLRATIRLATAGMEDWRQQLSWA